MNWRPGGKLEVGEVIYQITPLAQRPTAPKEPRGGCTVKHYDHYHHIRVWGSGWANSDWGEMLKNELMSSDLLPDTFDFSYGQGANDREWNVTMYTKAWNDGYFASAVRNAGADFEFQCTEIS